MKRLLSHDPKSGRKTYMHQEDGYTYFSYEMDDAPLRESNKRRFNEGRPHASQNKLPWHHVGHISNKRIMEWFVEYTGGTPQKGVTPYTMLADQDFIDRKLRDPDNRDMLTAPGMI